VGKQKAVLDDLFRHIGDEFTLMSSSLRFDDLKNHLQIFKPDVLIISLGDELPDEYAVYEKIKDLLAENGTAAFIAGAAEACGKFVGSLPFMVAETFIKPFNYGLIKENINWYLQDRENKRAEEESIAAASGNGEASGYDAETGGENAEGADEAVDEVEVPGIMPALHRKEQPKKHVLVIDDDPLMLRVVKEQLRGLYDVAAAINGRIAYKFLESKHTDMILLDYEMPIENGKVVFGNIRKIPGNENTPIVFLTGVNDADRIREVLELNPQGYLLKPIERDALIAAIRKCIGK
jgi:CheY-like chemotaxis protein